MTKLTSLFADQTIETKTQPASRRSDQPKRLAPFSSRVLGKPADLFRTLTQRTCPHGGEGRYYHKALAAMGFADDSHGNYLLTIGEQPTTAFMAHLDTADMVGLPIKHVITEGVCRTDGKTILGADDRAGVTILLYMAHRGVRGKYCLFVGEECGCIGSMASAKETGTWEGIRRAVSFDRRGKTSVITHQCGERTCSQEFASTLAEGLNRYGFQFAPDSGGVYTDSMEFAGIIPECTNLSVGYEHAHSNNETQDLAFLSDLAKACCLLDWESLPTAREPKRDRRGWRNGSDDWPIWPEEETSTLSWREEEDSISLLARQFLSDATLEWSALVALAGGDHEIALRFESLLLACREGIFG